MAGTEKMSAAAARWAEHIEKQRASGLSIRAYAEQEGFKPGTLSFWKWKLLHDGKDAVAIAPLRFVELTTREPERRAEASNFEVVLGFGRTVRVPVGFDAGELKRLVIVLEEVRS